MTTTIRRHECGFTMVAAIMILVVLAALGAGIAVISTTQQVGFALDLQGARAYQAARTGLEWGLYENNRLSSCQAGKNFVPIPASLSSFTVTVTCSVIPGTNGGPSVTQITSTACNQPSGGACPNSTNPGANYIERRLAVTL